MLYIAQNIGVIVKEVPVSFEDVPGSKLNVFYASISFIRDFFAMISFYNTGYWRIN
jgi:dolichyl-phosphate beta-glucosyltransferase